MTQAEWAADLALADLALELQAEWAADLALELNEGETEITFLELLDALGCCGLQLIPGDEAAIAFWKTLIEEAR
jgi:hypothetical protein